MDPFAPGYELNYGTSDASDGQDEEHDALEEHSRERLSVRNLPWE